MKLSDDELSKVRENWDLYEKNLEFKDQRLDQQARQIAQMKRIGNRMANLCYNGHQQDWMEHRYRESMRELYKLWDEVKKEEADPSKVKVVE